MEEQLIRTTTFSRNVILFEPYNLGTTVTYSEHYQDIFRVFYTNEYHFDSVYTLDYIEFAAICQCKYIRLDSVID